MSVLNIEIRVEKADKGECIWIRYGTESKANIIIDSGPGTFAKGYRKLMNDISELGEIVDLLVLTHIDNDHIMGFKKYIATNDGKLIKKIWVNGDGLKMYIKNNKHSPSNISSLIEKIRSNNIEIITPVSEGYEENINNANLKVIAPKYEALLDVAEVIDRNKVHSSSLCTEDIDRIILRDTFKEDISLTNKASISFVFTYEGKKIAFLGDSHASNIINGKIKYFKNQSMDLVKISHHGSKYNTNYELLKILGATKFIISTKGIVNKETIARIVSSSNKVEIYCNYNWWQKISYFTDNDKEVYIDTGKLIICEKNILISEVDI